MAIGTISQLRADLKAAVCALERSEARAAAGQLALEVMHEIKNPLEALGYLTYLAREDAENPKKVRQYMQLADEQMSTLRYIANQTLGFAKSSELPQPSDLVALTDAALRLHRRSIEKKHVHLIKDLPEGLVVKAHKQELLLVISNLIVNALDALPAEGVLSLRLRKRAGEVRFLIADNGQGIPKEHIELVFESFFTTKGASGTGLGLALSKKIIERHNGTIQIRSSVRPGRSGTALRISLPA